MVADDVVKVGEGVLDRDLETEFSEGDDYPSSKVEMRNNLNSNVLFIEHTLVGEVFERSFRYKETRYDSQVVIYRLRLETLSQPKLGPFRPS